MKETLSHPIPSTERWTLSDMPTQRGRLAIVTGTGGLGFEDALALARAGSEVVVAGRSPERGAAAVATIRSQAPTATVRFEPVDLASLESIARFGERLRSQTDRLDLLVNNAGVMAPPRRQETRDGFELQFGVNHLGHFALSAELMPLLRRAEGSRVVTLSSVAARQGELDFEDLQAERRYRPMPVYSRSKLACLMFALELQRRSQAGGWGVTSLAAHPGISRTELLYKGAGRVSFQGLMRTLLWFLFQPVAQGALPTLFAATSPMARGGVYYGPARLGETRGGPVEAVVPERAQDLVASARLWEISERLTGVGFSPPSGR